MRKILLVIVCLVCLTNSRAQVSINIAPGTTVIGSGTVQVSVGAGNFVNNGSYIDTAGTFNILGGTLVSGSGTTIFQDLNINNTGVTRFNSPVSVFHTANLISGDFNADSNLLIRSDVHTSSDMVVTGVLNGYVAGLITKPSAASGPCPSFTPALSLNIGGPVVNYQWQRSADSVGWANVAGATSATYSPSVTAAVYYRCRLRTTNSSFDEVTPGVKLTLTGIPTAVTVSGSGAHCGSALLMASGGIGGTIYYQDTVSGGVSLYATDSQLVTSSGTYYFRSRSAAGCWSPQGSATVSIAPRLTPSITVFATPGFHVCQGTLVDFTAEPVHGGSAPAYHWFVNSVPVAASDSTFTYAPANGDSVRVMLTSSEPCVTNSSVNAWLDMIVDSLMTPSVAIIAVPGITIAHGQSDTLVAVVTNGGPSPTYQWFKNGTAISGATSAAYVSNAFNNKDSITCVVTGDGNCATSSFNSVIITTTNVGIKNLIAGSSINIIPNPSKGDFTVKGTLPGMSGDVNLEVSDMLGKIVYRNSVTLQDGKLEQHIGLTDVANGMYILTVQANGEQAAFHLVIEQ